MKRLLSGRSSTCSRLAGSVKLGQPVPESNLVSEEKSSVPQPTQRYMPCSWLSQCSPVNGASVPARRVTSYCSGVSCWRHSCSDLRTFSASVDTSNLLVCACQTASYFVLISPPA